MNNMSLTGKKIELTKAYLMYIPPQHQIYQRSFEVAGIGDDLFNKFLDTTHDCQNLDYGTMSSIASSIINPSFIPTGKIQLPNGTENARLAFMLEIVTSDIYGTTKEIIEGYTNYVGVTNNSIDPNMVFYLNSRIQLNEVPVVNSQGTAINRKLQYSHNILNRVPNNDYAVGLRPSDVVAFNQMEMIGANSIDTRVVLSDKPQPSLSFHNIPAYWLSDICSGYAKSTDPTADYSNFEHNRDANFSRHSDVMATVRTESLNMSSFYNAVNERTLRRGDTFTFADLQQTWPRSFDFYNIILPRPGSKPVSPLDYTEHWHGATIETSIVYSLTHTMPSIMRNMLLEKLVVSITNNTMGGRPLIQPISYHEMFAGSINQQTMHFLIGQIERHVVIGLLSSKAVMYNIMMEIDILGTSNFHISIDGKPSIPYTAPSFCDSIMSPMIGKDIQALETMAHELSGLTNGITCTREQNLQNQTRILLPVSSDMGRGNNVSLTNLPNASNKDIAFNKLQDYLRTNTNSGLGLTPLPSAMRHVK